MKKLKKTNGLKKFIKIILIILAIIIGVQLVINAGGQIKKNRADMKIPKECKLFHMSIQECTYFQETDELPKRIIDDFQKILPKN